MLTRHFAILQVYREQLKPGSVAAYTRIEEEASQTCVRLRCPNPYLALKSVSGPEEVWFLNGYDSPAALEAVWEAYRRNIELLAELSRVSQRKADLVFPPHTVFARCREHRSRELSHSPAVGLRHVRFIAITTVRCRPEEVEKYEKGNTTWVYQTFSGMTDGTFLLLSPLGSIQDAVVLPTFKFDPLPGGTAPVSETFLFAVVPAMSCPAKEWIDADPEFWAPAVTTA